jgi:hypothetical protein
MILIFAYFALCPYPVKGDFAVTPIVIEWLLFFFIFCYQLQQL